MGARAFGIAQYVSYKVNDIFKVNGRAEFFRDNNNFFVSALPGYFDSVNLVARLLVSVLHQPEPGDRTLRQQADLFRHELSRASRWA